MPIRFRCQHCRKRSSIATRMVGQVVPCPSCGQSTLVASEEESRFEPDDLIPLKTSPEPLASATTKSADESVSRKAAAVPNARSGDTFDFPDIQITTARDKNQTPSREEPAKRDLSRGAKVEISDPDGNVDTRWLSKSAPLSFGKHSTNDVVLNDDDVANLHCRISWNGSDFELTAPHQGGVDVNGTLVQTRVLRDKDVLRIGHWDVEFFAEELAATPPKGLPARRTANPINLDKLDSAINAAGVFRLDDSKRGARDAKAADKVQPRDDEFAGSPPTSELTLAEVIEDDENFAAGEEVADIDAEDDAPRERKSFGDEGNSSSATPRLTLPAHLRAGKQGVLRNNLVLILSGTGIVLLLSTLVFWFLVQREKVAQQFEAAVLDIKQGQFNSGIKRLEAFLKNQPDHALSKGSTGARVLLDKALVEKELTGTPAWPEGLKALKEFVSKHRDEKYFEDLYADLQQFAKLIAIGAPKTAAQSKDRSLLELSTEAEQFFDRFSPPDTPQTETKREIAKARADAEATILKFGVVTAAFTEIDTALKKESPFPVAVTRQKLLVRYPDLSTDKKLDGALRKSLELAKQQVVREELNRDAQTDDPAKRLPKPLTLAVRTRALSEEQSANRVVFALGQDVCFGLDSITGDPLWRRVVGLDTPFFPVPVETSRSAVLVFDTSQQQLMLLDRRTGELLWRQVVEPVAGPPLVVQGQIYLPTLAGFLYRIDADSGRTTSRLKFPQKLLAPPIAMADGLHLFVLGDFEFAYTLGLDPLECKLVSHVGHQPDTIKAAPLAMGQHVLIAENDRATSARLRVLNTSQPQQRVTDVAEIRVEGHVRDELVLRGTQMFVVSGGPRLSVFNVSDDKNQRTLAPISTLQIPISYAGAAHLAAGADGQIWIAAGALRKVQLKTDVLQLDQQAVAVGHSVQPVQMIGRSLYVGRQSLIGPAVHLTQADGESMSSNWKTVVGASLLAATPGADGQLACVSSGADTFLISANELANGGFRVRAEQSLKISDQTTSELQAVVLSEGRITVWTTGAEGKLWVIGPTAQPQQEVALTQPLECAPLRFAGGILLPQKGRLKLAGRSAGPPCDDFLAPVDTTDDAPQRSWKFLVPIDDDQLFVFDSAGKLLKLQYRTGDKCFFQSVSQMKFPQPIDVAPVLHNGRLITADAVGTLRVLDVTAMETRAEVALGTPASKPLWVAGPLLLAEVGRQKLVAFDIAQPKQPLWSLNLDGAGIVGSPQLIDDIVIAVQQNGDVLRIDAKTGRVTEKLSLGQIATHGPIRLGNLLVVISADGSMHHVESLVPSLAAAREKPKNDKPEADDKPESKDSPDDDTNDTPKTE